MSAGKLSDALVNLFIGNHLGRETASMMEEVNALIANGNYTEEDLQEAVLVRSGARYLPIHVACICKVPLEVIQMLLDSDAAKKSILVKNDLGNLPIHYACKYGNASVEVIRLLLDSDVGKKTILVKDGDGRLPIYVACWYKAPLEVIQLLMQASICDRLEQLGLPQCKRVVEGLINAIVEDDTREEKTKKVQQIYKRLAKYEEMKGTVLTALELAVWRTSCLKWGGIEFQSMEEIEDLRATDETFDPVEYKIERLDKSGAAIIVHGVLQFMPVDDD
jgi:hypothetical protein